MVSSLIILHKQNQTLYSLFCDSFWYLMPLSTIFQLYRPVEFWKCSDSVVFFVFH